MRIATMVRGYMPSPRPPDMTDAPIDMAVTLAQGLTQRGHEVTYFGPIGTRIPGGVRAQTLDIPPLVRNQTDFDNLTLTTRAALDQSPWLWDGRFVLPMLKRAERGEFDLVHFHHPEVAPALARLMPNVPVAYTLHDPICTFRRDVFDRCLSSNQHLVSISKGQRRDAPHLPFRANIYNGVDLQSFRFSDSHDDFLLFAGRIVPNKGVKEAIDIAEATGRRLLIIGQRWAENADYFERHVEPRLNDQVRYLGHMTQEQLATYYQRAAALLMPIQWEEPFGLTMIEAMACGTPVIGLRRGSVPEIVAHGRSGFVCDNVAEMIDAVGKLSDLDAIQCRDHVERKFSAVTMVDGYEEFFQRVINQSVPRTHHAAVSPPKAARVTLSPLPTTGVKSPVETSAKLTDSLP